MRKRWATASVLVLMALIASVAFVQASGPSDQDERSKLADQVIADDLIVQGSGCVGVDCTDNMVFDADTIILKENNTRILFDDTSSSAAFPFHDWRLTANDRTNGGENYFSIEDATEGSTPFKIMGNAPTGSLVITTTGAVSMGGPLSAEALRVVGGMTSTLRLEQNDTLGAAPQVWEISGDENALWAANVTTNTVPFSISSGAPNGALWVDQWGRVGMGTNEPGYDLDVRGTGGDAMVTVQGPSTAQAAMAGMDSMAVFGSLTDDSVSLAAGLNTSFVSPKLGKSRAIADATLTLGTDGSLSVVAGLTQTLALDANGNLTIRGALTEASDVNRKENFAVVDGKAVLASLADFKVMTWNYIGDDPAIMHMGPIAQDFYATYGLGVDDKHISPLDANGVTLAAVQALNEKVDAQAAEIEALEQRLADLEALLAKLAASEE